MRCKNCGAETSVYLIDCRFKLGTPEREQRFCPGCRPEALEPGQRTFVADRLGDYPIWERLADLLGTAKPEVH